MQELHDRTVKGKVKAMRSTVVNKRPRGEEGCPIRRHRVSPLERGGNLDVADFLSGSQQDGTKLRSSTNMGASHLTNVLY